MFEQPNKSTNMAPASTNPTGDLTSEVLQALSKSDPVSSTDAFPGVPFESIKAALDRLASRSMVVYEQVEREEAFLEPEAETIVNHGSHEARVFEAVRQALDGLSIQDLESKIGDKTVTKVGQGKAFKEKWIKKDGAKLVALVCYVSLLVWILKLTVTAGRLDQRCDSGSAQGDPGKADTRRQDSCRFEEAQVAQDAKGHIFSDKQGAQVCTRNGQGGDGPYSRNAGIWSLEDGYFQAVQLQSTGCGSTFWCPTSPEQSSTGVQVRRRRPRLRVQQSSDR